MKTKYNYKKLNGKIVEIFGTADNMAKAISMNRSTLSKKLNNHVDFSSKDIDRISTALSIPRNQIGEYFFAAKVEKTQP